MEPEGTQSFIIIVCITFVILVVLMVFILIFIQKKKINFILDKRKQEENFKAELLNSRAETQEQTLKNVAYEIHDNVGQLLSVTNLQLGIEVHKTKNEKLFEVQKTLKQAISELRSLSHSLNSDYLKRIGLIQAVKNELDRINKMRTMKTEILVSGEEFNLSEEQEIILFRIIQEFINNSLKYSEAKKLVVQFTFSAKVLSIIAIDDGKGISNTELKNGSGLINMENRTKLIGADFTFETAENKGVKISITNVKSII